MIKKFKFKTLALIGSVLLLTLFMARPWIEKGLNRIDVFDATEYKIEFIDDSGYRIRMERPASTIISLYSAHTENLFALGLDREIIGVGTSDVYPYEALSKTIYDYKSDPEKVIASHPDVVIIRPFIERHSPDFVNSLRRSGITVVSLYPDTFIEFDEYINKLSMITGKEKTAKLKLDEFHEELERIRISTENIEERVGVYFESSDREYKTVTNDSMAAYAIDIAGGSNIASDAVPIEEDSSVAIYGIEKILEKAEDIDVYVTQRGVMGAGGNYHSISIRPGFHAIKAVRDNRIFELNQKIISSPTFRYVKGVKALQRAFYPEVYDNILLKDEAEKINRAELSEILVKISHEVIFVPTSSYYSDANKDHYYGAFVDVNLESEYFDYVETAMQKSYFTSTLIDEEEFFYPEDYVTRAEFARILYLINDLNNDDSITINDLSKKENERIIKAVISSGLMKLDNGNFYPEEDINWYDAVKGLKL